MRVNLEARANTAAVRRDRTRARLLDAAMAIIARGGVEAASVDAVISNGVINLATDKTKVFREVARLLKPHHDVITAASGAEGRAILAQDASFDLILCDLMMPEMTGMDLHEWLVGRNPELAAKMVFVTGAAFTPKASDYLTKTGRLRIDKPFDAAELVALVSRLVLPGTA